MSLEEWLGPALYKAIGEYLEEELGAEEVDDVRNLQPEHIEAIKSKLKPLQIPKFQTKYDQLVGGSTTGVSATTSAVDASVGHAEVGAAQADGPEQEEVRAAAVAEPLPDGYTESGQLLKAVMNGDVATAEKWLEMGVNPNAGYETLADWTPLHYAAQLGHVDCINMLLKHGAKPQPKDQNGETPLMQAGYWGQTLAAECLKNRGGGRPGDVPPVMVVRSDTDADRRVGSWADDGHVVSH